MAKGQDPREGPILFVIELGVIRLSGYGTRDIISSVRELFSCNRQLMLCLMHGVCMFVHVIVCNSAERA